MTCQNTHAGAERECSRRGVLLLLALVMLTLFLMLGTTYMIATSQRRPCGSLLGVVGLETVEAAKEVVSLTTDKILVAAPDVANENAAPSGGTGPSAPERVKSFLRSSLFADKFGTRCQLATLVSTIQQITTPSAAVPGLYRIVAGPTTVTPENGEFGLSDNTLGAFAGRIVSVKTPQGSDAAAFRILASFDTGTDQKAFYAHLLNSTSPFETTLFPAESRLSIQGREFTGKSSSAADSVDWHESYDAPDSRNQFLAWNQVDSVLGRNHVAGDTDAPAHPWRFIVPSFHRPDKLLAAMKEYPANFPTQWLAYATGSPPMMLRPRGRMSLSPDVNWEQYGFSDEEVTNLKGTFQNAEANTSAVEHPNFTGTNVRLIDGSKVYFDPINGPWDVDNDGDGVTDSVWIDVGMPEVTLDDVRCQPLVAIMMLDLDSRANVNVHDSLADSRFGASPLVGNPAATTGVVFAGTDPSSPATVDAAPRNASAASGIGWGPADLRLRHLFNPSGNSEATAWFDPGFESAVSQLLKGTEATGSAVVSGGLAIPNSRAEGRYGDAVNRPGIPAALTPAPGLLGISDPPIDRADVSPLDNHLPNRFGARDAAGQPVKPLGSPIDPWGVATVVLDQMGQPYFARNGGAAAWQGDTIDDPYDLSVGLNAPKPGWSFDPNVTTSPSTFQDNLYTPTQLERLLRLYEPRTESLNSRLVSLLGSASDVSRLTLTTESWDTTAVCVPLALLNEILKLYDQNDKDKPSLISWDLQLGVKMDVNRPFGNGLDDNANGIADEPSETGEPTFSQLAANNWNLTNLCNGRAPNNEARSLFARHLYCLIRLVCPAVPAKEAAQWAVNVVDFRDSDSIMTHFRYDPAFDRNSTTWNVDNSSPAVWGCERPEALITEVIAWRNVLEMGHGNPVVNDWTWNDLNTGGLMVELFHPWTSETDAGVRGNPIPAEFMRPNAINENNGYAKNDAIDLAKLSGDGTPEAAWPIFQLVVVRDSSINRDKLLADPAWPMSESESGGNVDDGDTNDIERLIYLGPRSTKLHKDRFGQSFGLSAPPSTDAEADATTLRPGQCGVIAGPSALVPSSPVSLILPIMTQMNDTSQGVVMTPTDFSDSAPMAPLYLSEGLNEHIKGDATKIDAPAQDASKRQTARVLPKDAGFGPVGAMICVTPESGTDQLRIAPHTGSSYDTLKVISNQGRYRVLLRRLANPLEHYDRVNNPYITIDSAVFHEQGVIYGGEGNPSHTATITLTSAERGDGAPAEDNNLWKQSDADINAPSATYDAKGAAAGAYPYCGRLDPANADAVRWTMGFLPSKLRLPGDGDRETPPFPWLTWLNREYANVHELLLVPKSSPAALLNEHSHEFPFGHLFFGGGAEDNEVDPDDRLGILEFLRTVSRFADAEFVFPIADSVALSQQLVAANGKPLLLPPHNRLTTFREPGRVNLNTLSSSAIWNALNGGRPPAPYEDEVVYEDTGAELAFEPSEDWGLITDDAIAPPSTGNWSLDTTISEDVNGNGRLDFHHDVDNNGFQARSREGILRSLATSRRGWPHADPSTTVAGQFDRVLNRRGVQPANTWFINAFRSGWEKDSPGSYEPNASLLLRRRRTVDAYVRLKKPASGYGRMDQQVKDLIGGREYSISIRFRDNYQPGAGDIMPQFRQGSNYFSASNRTNGPGFASASFTPPASGDYMLTLSLFSRDFVDVKSVVMFDTVTGKQLVKNTTFKELTGATPTAWGTEGGSIEAMGLNPVDNTDPGLNRQPDFLFSPNLYLRGEPDAEDGQSPLVRGFRYSCPERNPYFAYRDVMRLSNLTTPRSNVFAVWITVGFFEVEPHPDNPAQMALGAEYGLDTGKSARHKAFMLIDRSIPVGFRVGQTLTEQAAILLDKFEQ